MNDRDPSDAVADAATVAAQAVSDAASVAAVVVGAAADAANAVAEVQRRTLATLESIDAKLDGLPGYNNLLSAEVRDRRRGQRVLAVLGAVVLVLVLAVAALGYKSNQDRIAGARANRCGIRRAVASTFDVLDDQIPDLTPAGRKVLARITREQPGDCTRSIP